MSLGPTTLQIHPHRWGTTHRLRLLLAVMLWNSMLENPHVPVYRGWNLKQNKRNNFTILHS